MNKNLITFAVGAVCGLTLSFIFLLFLIPRFQLPRDHQLFQVLGIKKPVIVGFLPYWLVSKATDDYTQKLTMLSYFGLMIGTDGHIVKKVSPQELEPGYYKLQSDEVKQKLSDAKKNHITLSLLVYSQNEASISALVKDPVKHAENLMADVLPLMKEHGFTDLNIDVESFRDAEEEDRKNFTLFVKTVREKINQEKTYTLSIDLAPRQVIEKYIYEPFELGQLVDTVILMTYDYSQRSSSIAGPVAPIGGVPNVRNFDINVSVKETLKVIPSEKLVLGIPLYGYQWETLSNAPGRPTIPSSGATASQRRINDEVLATCVHCTKAIDPISLQPYLITPGTIEGIFQQIFYEDEESLQKKTEFAKEKNLAGVALWALGYEHVDVLHPLVSYKQQATWKK